MASRPAHAPKIYPQLSPDRLNTSADYLRLVETTPDLVRDHQGAVHEEAIAAAPEALDPAFAEAADSSPALSFFRHRGITPNRLKSATIHDGVSAEFIFSPEASKDPAGSYEALRCSVNAANGFILAVPASSATFRVRALFPSVTQLHRARSNLSSYEREGVPLCDVIPSIAPLGVGIARRFPFVFQDPSKVGDIPPPTPEDPKEFPVSSDGLLMDYSGLRTPPHIQSSNGTVIQIEFLDFKNLKYLNSLLACLEQTFLTHVEIVGNTITAIVQREGSEASLYLALRTFLNKVSNSGLQDFRVYTASGNITQTPLGKDLHASRFFSGDVFVQLELLRAQYGDPGVYTAPSTQEMLETVRQKNRVQADFDGARLLKITELSPELKTDGPDKIVGRDIEVSRAHEMVEQFAIDGVHQRIFLQGPPGVGKTCFMEHLQQWILDKIQAGEFPDDLQCLHLMHYEEQKNVEGSSVRAFLKKLQSASFDSQEDLGVFTSSSDNAESMVDQLKEALAASGKRTVLFLDDLHWMDETSAKAFSILFEERPENLFVVGNDRGMREGTLNVQDRAPKVLRDGFIQENQGDILFEFGDLDFKNSPDLLHDYISGFLRRKFPNAPFAGQIPDDLAGSLAEASHGNPLMLKEYLLVLIKKEHLVVRGGRVIVQGAFRDVFHELKTGSDVFHSRLERFLESGAKDPDRRQELVDTLAWVHVFSRIPNDVTAELLPPNIGNNLPLMEDHALIQLDPLRFQHELVERAFLAMCPKDRLHLVAAQASTKLAHYYEKADSSEIFPGDVYRIAKEGGVLDLQYKYALAAGKEAYDQSDPKRAHAILEDFVKHALKNSSDITNVSQLELAFSACHLLTIVSMRLSKYDDASAILTKSGFYLELLEARGNISHHRLDRYLANLELCYKNGQTQELPGLCDIYQRSFSKLSENGSLNPVEKVRYQLSFFVYSLRTFYRQHKHEEFDQQFAEVERFLNSSSEYEQFSDDPDIQMVVDEIYRLKGNRKYEQAYAGEDPRQTLAKRSLLQNRMRTDAAEDALVAFKKIVDAADGHRPMMDTQAACSAFSNASVLCGYLGRFDAMENYRDRCLRLARHHGLPDAQMNMLLISVNQLLGRHDFGKEHGSLNKGQKKDFLKMAVTANEDACNIAETNPESHVGPFCHHALCETLLTALQERPEDQKLLAKFFDRFCHFFNHSNPVCSGYLMADDGSNIRDLVGFFREFLNIAEKAGFHPDAFPDDIQKIPYRRFVDMMTYAGLDPNSFSQYADWFIADAINSDDGQFSSSGDYDDSEPVDPMASTLESLYIPPDSTRK